MITLSCETSTLLGSVAIHKNDLLLAERNLMRQGSHSDSLNLMIDECLTESNLTLNQIDIFSCGVGPGSFTGIRISVNTIKTLAYVYNKPCSVVDSLENLATLNMQLSSQKNSKKTDRFVCAINAYKNMLYIAEYSFDNNKQLQIIQPPQVIRIQNLASFIKAPVVFIGDGYEAYKNYIAQKFSDLILRPDFISDLPKAAITGEISFKRQKFMAWSELLPIYLRASEAEENLNGIKYQPL